MKKLLILALATALCACALTACGRSDREPEPEARPAPAANAPTEVPAEGAHGEADQSAALEAMPTLEPVVPISGEDGASDVSEDYFSIDAMLSDVPDEDPPAPQEAPAEGDADVPAATQRPIDTSAYQYSALTDTSLGFTFNYPSHWENVPGVYSVCFREKVEPGDFPARVVITAKQLVHSPDEEVITEQLTAYLRIVHKQYDAATFQAGTPNTEQRFLGKPALSNTYLAFSGEHEVKGYIIGTAVGRTMYVFHFSATYEDYAALESVMRYMVNSAEIVDKND